MIRSSSGSEASTWANVGDSLMVIRLLALNAYAGEDALSGMFVQSGIKRFALQYRAQEASPKKSKRGAITSSDQSKIVVFEVSSRK